MVIFGKSLHFGNLQITDASIKWWETFVKVLFQETTLILIG